MMDKEATMQSADASNTFLLALYSVTGGDTAVKTSMHEVGATIGLDKAESGKMAENLIGMGWVEVKTLSGGIGITAEGIEAALNAGAEPPKGSGSGGAQVAALGAGPLLDAGDRRIVETLLAQAKQGLAKLSADYAVLEEMVIDIKTAEVQLLSPRAKTAVVRAVLRALQAGLAKSGDRKTAECIGQAVGK
jgi:hypothetical protein